MKINYCLIDKNKIYAEIYDELLEEELSMFNKDHNDKIKYYLEKKITNSKFINESNIFDSNNEIMNDLILKITSKISNDNLQGNTVLMFASPDEMYELFHMEDLITKINDEELNEFASISNIHLLPVFLSCGIFKSTYLTNVIKPSLISIKDIANIFIQNYYHIGVMIGINEELLEIEFTGEDPFKVIGTNFTQSNVTNVIGFNLIPYFENSNDLNVIASKIMGRELKGRMFISLLCPTTNKKFWNIDITTVKNIVKILSNEKLFANIEKELDKIDKDINPFYILKKTLYG